MKNNKKGFTLIELIVVMAILSILMTAVFALFSPVSKFHINTVDTDKRFTAVQGINDFVEKSVKFAKSVYVVANVDSPNNIKFEKGGKKEQLHEKMLKEAGLDPVKDMDKLNIIALYNKTADTSATSSSKGTIWSQDPDYKYTGRVYRVRGITDKSDYFKNEYMAFGPAYYGKYSYNFSTVAHGDDLKPKESSDTTLVLQTKIFDHEDNADKILDVELTSKVAYLNSSRSGAGGFKYIDAKNPDTFPEGTTGVTASSEHPNIFIFYINP